MCIITGSILGTIGAVMGAVAHSVAGFLGGIGAGLGLGTFGGVGTGVAASGFGWGSIAAGAVVVGGVAATGIVGVTSMVQSSRASAAAQKAQEEAIKKLSENTGNLEVNKTGQLTDNNSRINRTLSSLRIGMLPQKQTSEEIVNNAYGVDSNNVVSSTQNMTGLNIAA